LGTSSTELTMAKFLLDPLHESIDLMGQPLVQDVWREKYRRGEETTPSETISRVAGAVGMVDASVFGQTHKQAVDFIEDVYEAMSKGLWVPAGRILAGAGSGNRVTLLNCFVSTRIEDSMDKIADALKQMMLTQQRGGGIGMDFSELRPEGAELVNTGAIASGPLPFMDGWDSMCKTIMSAGFRRGAMMATMRCDHPDIEKFIEAKQTAGRLTNFNMSVLVTDAFLKAIRDDMPWDLVHQKKRAGDNEPKMVAAPNAQGYYIWKTVRARDLWNKIMRATYAYAEPGVIFIDEVNNMNNLAYCETISATNPCVTGDTLILTDQGHLPIAQLVGKKVRVWNGLQYSEVTPFATGINDTLKITFSNGQEVQCTHYHKWVLADGSRVEAKDLRVADKLLYCEMPTILDGPDFQIDAYSQGFYAGDGSVGMEYSSIYASKYCVISRLKVGKVSETEQQAGGPHRRWAHGKMLPKDFVPVTASATYCVNWLAGLLDADGCSEKSGRRVITLSSKSQSFLQRVGLMLNRLGVNYRVWNRRDEGVKKGSNGKEYMCQSTTALMISHKGVWHLIQLGLQCARLDLAAFSQKPQGVARVGHRVVAIAPAGKEETFCFNEPERHMGVFNGVVGANCGEQPLPPNGCCNLGAINLARLVKSPFSSSAEIDWVALKALVHLGVHFLDNVIEIGGYPVPEQEIEERNKRRIGLGVTGLADALAMMGIAYGNDVSWRKVEDIQRFIAFEAYTASAHLAAARGSFPLYDEIPFLSRPFPKKLPTNVYELIRNHGIRNGCLLTIAPTGTTSVWPCGNVSSGLEPVFRHQVERKVRQPDDTFKTYTAYGYGYLAFLEKCKSNPAASKAFQKVLVEAKDVPIVGHLNIQGAAQNWIDASVSKTINCPAGVDFEQFKHIYDMAFKKGCKGCTTFRPENIAVRGAILTEVKQEGETQKTEPLASDVKAPPTVVERPQKLAKRPEVLSGKTYKFKWPQADSAIYVTINNDEQGRPYEMFVSSKSGTYDAWQKALTRLISALMRLGIDISFVAEELQEISDARDSAWIGQKYYGSIVAKLGEILQLHLSANSTGGETQVVVPEMESSEEPAPTAASEQCPKCRGKTFIREEGCQKCAGCGYSVCGG
jgi:ribonucleoside-diphosphate reductase alpha chain